MSKNTIIKRILLIFLSIVAFFGTVSANSIGFHIKKKGGKEFRCYLSIEQHVGFAHFRKEGIYEMHLSCLNDQEKEQAKTILNGLVNDLIKEGYKDCLLKNTKTNGYLWFEESKSRDGYSNFVDVGIAFLDKPVEEIEIWESTKI